MNITYLFGAGASCESLPTVIGIPGALEKFAQDFKPPKPNFAIDFLKGGNRAENFLFIKKNNKDSFERYRILLNKFYKDILWLQKESKGHSSIDTFAKKLHLQKNHSDLKKLKIILSCFFTYLQTIKFDKRYDSFFASILEDIDSLPNNLKILSWNYDSQLEIAFKRFTNSSIGNSQSILNIYPKGLENNFLDIDGFSVFKINGTTSLTNNISDNEENNYNIIEDFDIEETNLTYEFLELYDSSFIRKSKPNMSFAWERNNSTNNFFKDLKKSISKTEILIVIGYSFPFFNRKIDKDILDAMTNLKKVYVQDPTNSESIIEKIKELKPWQENASFFNGKGLDITTLDKIEFKQVKFTDQFFIPIDF